MKRSLIGIAAITAGVLVLTACGSSSKTSSSNSASSTGTAVTFTGDPVVIGQEVCQTGYLAASDGPLIDGAKIAVQLLNASGGILHHKVELDTKDTQCVASNEIQLANTFISQSHVNAILGGFQSAAISGVIPVVQSAKVPFIGGGTLPLQSAWGITTFPQNTYVPSLIMDYFGKQKSVKTLGNITGDTPFGQAVQTNVDTAAKAAGVTTKDVQIANAATSTTPVLQQMSSADAIFTNTSGPINIIFSKDATTLGLKKPLIFQDSNTTCQQAGSNYSPVYCIVAQAAVYPAVSNPTIKDNETKLWDIYKSNGGQATNFATVTAGADQVNLIAKAMTTANSTDGQAVQTALASTSYVGAQAEYKFTPGNTFGITANPYVITTAKSDALTVVYSPTS